MFLNPFDLMAHMPCRPHASTFGAADMPILALHFLRNHLGLQEGATILPLTCLELHKCSNAGDEVHIVSIYFILQNLILFSLISDQN